MIDSFVSSLSSGEKKKEVKDRCIKPDYSCLVSSMVVIRIKERLDIVSPQYRIFKWAIFVGFGFAFLILNIHRTTLSSKPKGTVSTKLETFFPKPNGTLDHNLKKEYSTTTFNAFSFYLMGDTPVC